MSYFQIFGGGSGGGISADTVLTVSINTTVSSAPAYVKATGGAGGITITLPSPSTGLKVTVKKMDAAAGTVTVSGGTIEGGSSYLLINQFQYVVLESDGSVWDVVGNN